MASQPVSKFHAKVRLEWDGLDTELNIFSDSLLDLYRDLQTVTHATPEGVQQVLDGQPTHSAPQPAQPVSQAPVDERPVCQTCGTSEFMELIEFADRETGERKARWKCQQCQSWHWPDRKPGRKTARSRG